MEYKKLGDIATYINGYPFKPEDRGECGLPIIRIQDLTGNTYDLGYYDGKYPERIEINNGDILISWSASLGVYVWNRGKALLNQHIFKVVFDKVEINKRYFVYAVQFKLKEMEAKTHGATMKHIVKKDFDSTLIPYPSLKEQSRIAETIDSIAKTINMRQKELQRLDDLVKARFVEMFGTETELDKWHCGTVSDVADVCVGVVIKPTQYYADIGIPAFRSLNIGEMCVKDADWVYFTEEGHRKNQKSVIRKNDVLVVRSGAPGTACVASEKYAGYNAVDIIIAHPDNNKVNSVFLAAFTNMPHGMNQIRAKTGGAAQQHFNVGGYKAMRLIMPPIELQEQFAAFVEQIDKSKAAVQKALDETQLLFDSLMQQYLA